MPHHEVPLSAGASGRSRRELLASGLASGLALTLAGSLVGSHSQAAPRARQDQDADPPTPLEVLQAFSDSSQYQQMLAFFPHLLVTPFIDGNTTLSIAATQAALDVCELQRQAGLASLGLQFMDAFVRDDMLHRHLVTVYEQGAITWELLATYGVSDAEIDAAVQYPTFVSQLPQVDGRLGLTSATQAKIASLRANAATHVANAPQKCVVLVVGAALSTTALAALQEGYSSDAALLNAFLGFGSVGIGLGSLP